MSTDQASDLYALYTPELVAIFIFLGVFIIILCCLQGSMNLQIFFLNTVP